jgi:hypothetical protein
MAEKPELYAHLFDGVATRVIELRLLEETYQQAQALIDAQGWSAVWGDDAYLIIFAHGLAYLRAELARASAPEDSTAEDARLRSEWMATEAQYAVMKFRAYTLTQENQRLRWSLTAAERQLELAEHRLKLFREETRRLKAQLAAAQAPAAREPGELGESAVRARTADSARRTEGWLRTLWARFRGPRR